MAKSDFIARLQAIDANRDRAQPGPELELPPDLERPATPPADDRSWWQRLRDRIKGLFTRKPRNEFEDAFGWEEQKPRWWRRLVFWNRGIDPAALIAQGEDEFEDRWPLRRKLLYGAWAALLATVGGVAAWLIVAPPPAQQDQSLVLTLAPPEIRATDQRGQPISTAPVEQRNTPEATAGYEYETGPSGGLPAAPDPALQQQTRNGLVPMIGKDGRIPWQVYGRPFNDRLNRARVAVVVTGLGLLRNQTDQVLERLPPGVTLAISPYAPNVRELFNRARAKGFETLTELPLEPTDYPASDPGPRALYTSLTPADNEARLDWIMSRGAGYVGLIDVLGTKPMQDEAAARRVLGRVQERGLLFVDSRASTRGLGPRIGRDIGLAMALNNRFVDSDGTAAAIDAKLDELERLAKASGASVGIASGMPQTVDRIIAWNAELHRRGVALAPISAVIGRQRE